VSGTRHSKRMLSDWFSAALQTSRKYGSYMHTTIRYILVGLLALLQGCATNNNYQTMDFRVFIRDFFEYQEYQVKHIKFPLEFIYYEYDDPELDFVLKTKFLTKESWEHLPGPAYYQCQTSCFDILIYDNFERQHKETGKRVLSFEGAENGINSALYFELIDGEWFLVKYEQLDT